MDTYEVLDKDGNWEEVTFPDPRLKEVRNALRMLKISAKRIGVEQIPLHKQFAHKAYEPVGVSREFFQLTRKTFRGLHHSPARWQLMEYILFHARPDKSTGKIPLPQALLARMEGAKVKNKKAKDYSATPLLWWFQNCVMTPQTFQFSEAKPTRKLCRQITKLVFPDFYEEAWKKQLAEGKPEVFFCGGEKYSKPKVEAWRKAKRQQLKVSQESLVVSPTTRTILDYLNNSDPEPFQQILRDNYAHAVKKAQSLEENVERELPILKAIRSAPQPYYLATTSGNSPRIYAEGLNITSLKRKLRKAYTRGWMEADLRAAQLAINAKIWGANLTLSLLEDDLDVWESFYDYCDIPPDEKDKVKGAFKITLYATWYQRKKVVIGKLLEEELLEKGVERDMSSIVDHPIVKEILRERHNANWQIIQNNGMEDILGNWIAKGRRSVGSVMAQAAQVAEMELLHPVVEMAKTTKDFQITLFQHDGFSVLFRREQEKWMERIEEVVQEKARSFGYPTGLEWEEL
jgi:hypothetical protein